MKIGIDISQIVHEGTGISTYVRNLISALVLSDATNEYILFGTSFRKRHLLDSFVQEMTRGGKKKVRLVSLPIPPTLLSFLWNNLHIVPVEWFTGPLDIFWSSDWTQPPLARARGVTTIHDLAVLRYPEESYNAAAVDITNARISPNIVATQKKRLFWVARECRMVFCDSKATQSDVIRLLHISKNRTTVIYPGIS